MNFLFLAPKDFFGAILFYSADASELDRAGSLLMNKIVPLGFFLTLVSGQAVSAGSYFDQSDASEMVRDFSEIVACQTPSFPYKNQLEYKAIKIKDGMDGGSGFGVQYIVFWSGDYGCAGGNGTVTPHFSLVERTGFSSADPIVRANHELPHQVKLTVVSDFYAAENEEGVFYIDGLTYGSDDQQHHPTKPVSYKIKADYDGYKVLAH